ncbi:hypothetical protein Salat_2543900 [Sesamum alatum]|uniref:Uncharacterized protein n=1 Tax=Sesamum alatum TaxID=300844 RepID=A0AAE2CCJ6_9LAMI|nr:hypothetical protein Salat_2543900 [Sesamum alatum]
MKHEGVRKVVGTWEGSEEGIGLEAFGQRSNVIEIPISLVLTNANEEPMTQTQPGMLLQPNPHKADHIPVSSPTEAIPTQPNLTQSIHVKHIPEKPDHLIPPMLA